MLDVDVTQSRITSPNRSPRCHCSEGVRPPLLYSKERIVLERFRDMMSGTSGRLQNMLSGRLRKSLAIVAILVVILGALAVARFARAASYCTVTYAVTSQWSGGFGV